MTPNAALKALYESKWTDFQSVRALSNDDNLMHGPFLCSPGASYWDSKVKVVFVGRETNGWEFKGTVDSLMLKYASFNVGKDYKYKGGPYWSMIRKIEFALNGDNLNCATLNLNKFDVNSKTPTGDYLKSIMTLDYIVLAELDLLQPDIVIFFTGPTYDNRVTSLFNTPLSEVAGFTKRQFAEIKLSNKQYKVFRTYHPKTLRLRKLESRAIEKISSVFRVNEVI